MPGILWRASLRETLAPSQDSLVPVNRVCADYFREGGGSSGMMMCVSCGVWSEPGGGFASVFFFIPCCLLLIVQTLRALCFLFFQSLFCFMGFVISPHRNQAARWVYFHLLTLLRPHTRSCDGCKYSAKQQETRTTCIPLWICKTWPWRKRIFYCCMHF